MSFLLSWGFDRGLGDLDLPYNPVGSGGHGRVGTPIPFGHCVIHANGGNLITLEEMPDSPTIERGTQCTAHHRFKCSYYDGTILLGAISMGTIVEDYSKYLWRVLTCTLQSMEGTAAVLSTVSESISFDVPPDEFQCNSVDLGIDIIKHPRYFPNIYPTDGEMGTFTGQVKEAIIRSIQTYRDSPFFPTAANLYGLVNGQVQNLQVAALKNGSWVITVPNVNYKPQLDYVADLTVQDGNGVITPPIVAVGSGTGSEIQAHVPPFTNDPTIPVSINAKKLNNPSILLALAAAQEIISKLWRMEDSPYVAGIELKWTQYYFLPPLLNLGSFIEDPTLIVPNYFLQPDHVLTELPPRSGLVYPPADRDNIFKYNAAANPQDYSNDGTSRGLTQISWLRKGDEITYERTWFKITYTWIGSAVGYWDLQIYGASERPKYPQDYLQFA